MTQTSRKKLEEKYPRSFRMGLVPVQSKQGIPVFTENNIYLKFPPVLYELWIKWSRGITMVKEGVFMSDVEDFLEGRRNND